MKQAERKIVIIDGGIAGLCAAVYARKCAYAVELLEQDHSAGGLAASWRRGDYIFETCLHWLVGSNPTGNLHAEWQEVCDIDTLRFVDHEEFVCLENEHGASLHAYTDADRLEAELSNGSPRRRAIFDVALPRASGSCGPIRPNAPTQAADVAATLTMRVDAD